MDNNSPLLFIDSTSAEYLANPKTRIATKHRTLTYDYFLKERITKCPHCEHEGVHIHKNKTILLKQDSTGYKSMYTIIHIVVPSAESLPSTQYLSDAGTHTIPLTSKLRFSTTLKTTAYL